MSMRNDRWRIFETLYGGPNPTGQTHRPIVMEHPGPDPADPPAPSHDMVGPINWWAIPDDHPGWLRLIRGMNRVTRTHGVPGHRCTICDQLNRELGRAPDKRRAA